MKKLICLIAALTAGAAHALPVQFDVYAAANSSSGGSGLDTGIAFTTGDSITVSADPLDLWNAGPLPRWSNADGLTIDLYATGTDESGAAAGSLIGQPFADWSQNGLTAPYGSLVGRLGSTYFLLGTSFSGPAPDSGNLLLYYWDADSANNTDFVTVTVDNGIAVDPTPTPAPGGLALFGLGLAGFSWHRRKSR
jgi:hypothetical protein